MFRMFCWGILVAVGLSSCHIHRSDVSGCNFADVAFSANFSGGRLNSCQKTDEKHYRLYIKAENQPINDSAWYAFKINSKRQQHIYLELVFEGGTARYSPKMSRDRVNWQAVNARFSQNTISLNVDIDREERWLAGQELWTATEYESQRQRWQKNYNLASEIIGHSVEGRSVHALIHKSTSASEWLVLLGRQHPPEITGAQALDAFVEGVFSEAGSDFRKRFNILIVPLLNPDGVEHGHWRHNVNGIDLNRDWKNFSQPETRALRDYFLQLYKADERIVYALDFHSTRRNVFYTMPGDYALAPKNLTDDWLQTLAQSVAPFPSSPPFTVTSQPGHNPDQGVFKQYIADTYHVHAATYEMGDNTSEETIRRVANVAAKTLMNTMLALPPDEYIWQE